MELVERATAFDLLQTEFDKIGSGEGHCVFISGEAGIGKTALVKAFCTLNQKKSVIYQGSCDALFTPRPLAPLYDIMWQVKSDLWRRSDSLEDRSQLFLEFFNELSHHRGNVIIVFEDIHWADEATLDFIKFFARRISRLRCLFILTYRDDENTWSHHLGSVFGSISPDIISRIQLHPLSKEAVYKLAAERGYHPETLYKVSGGNPFYLNEILASYSRGIPDNVKDSILSVYNRQEEETRNAWQICSVVPEGLEINRFTKLKSSWEGMNRCFELNILMVKNNRVIFKHELYRRTIEASLSPFKRIELNKKILQLLLDSLDTKEDIERIVHYAKNANENEVVVKYAPIAARQAASVGAHMEASKLFLTAIEYSQGNDVDRLLEYYEAFAYECYLINQTKEAIIYQGKALKIWEEKKDMEKAGNSMRILSRLWWFDGNRVEAERYAKLAIDKFESRSPSKAKAMALSNMSQLKMQSEDYEESVYWGSLAIEMASEINDVEILCHALNNMGSLQWKLDYLKASGKELLLDSLKIAIENSFYEHAARAYSNIASLCLTSRDYESCEKFLDEGIIYCEEHGLDASKNYKLYIKTRMLLETGRPAEAETLAESLLLNRDQLGTVKMSTLVILLMIKARSGRDILSLLEETKKLIFKTEEHQRIIPLMIAILQYEWLSAKQVISPGQLTLSIELAKRVNNLILNSEFDYWLQKTRNVNLGLEKLYEPYQLLKENKSHAAAIFWQKKHCLFEQALMLFEGNEKDKKAALAIFDHLQASAVCEKIKKDMRAVGIRKIPRGRRESTKLNPMNLTNRELDILGLLQKGSQNKEIAHSLFISPKTVDHHISSILFKLDVNSRSKAVAEAMRLNILQ